MLILWILMLINKKIYATLEMNGFNSQVLLKFVDRRMHFPFVCIATRNHTARKHRKIHWDVFFISCHIFQIFLCRKFVCSSIFTFLLWPNFLDSRRSYDSMHLNLLFIAVATPLLIREIIIVCKQSIVFITHLH